MSKVDIPGLSFHITNRCNLNCDGCYTLSNFGLDGHQHWHDYKDIISQWGNKLELSSWSIYGGEPTLNPTLLDWIDGLMSVWPNASGIILTNGYILKSSNKTLYHYLAKFNGKVKLKISLHNVNLLDEFIGHAHNWLEGPVTVSRHPELETLLNSELNWKLTYDKIRDASWPDCNSWKDFYNLPKNIQTECQEVFNLTPETFADQLQGYTFVDSNNIKIEMDRIYFHSMGTLIPQNDFKTFKLHNSDPVKAHDICGNKFCSEMFKGKLYKCNTVAHFSDFEKQFYVDLDESDRELLHSGRGYGPDELEQFFDDLDKPMPQCKFCPENLVTNQIYSSTKQIKFVKKQYRH